MTITVPDLWLKLGVQDVLPARVEALGEAAVNVRVTLGLPDGDRLVAVVTQHSAQALGLAPGTRVLALPMGPGVLLSRPGTLPMADTCWQATVAALTTGPMNAQAVLRTALGTSLHAVVTRESARELGLAPGVAVQVGVLASHVMLALPAAR